MPKDETTEDVQEQRKRVLEARKKNPVHKGKTGITFQVPELYKGKLKTQEELRKEAEQVSEALKKVQEATINEEFSKTLEVIYNYFRDKEIALGALFQKQQEFENVVKAEMRQKLEKQIETYNEGTRQFVRATDGLIKIVKAYNTVVKDTVVIKKSEKARLKKLIESAKDWDRVNVIFNESAEAFNRTTRDWNKSLACLNRILADFDNMCDAFYKAYPEIQPYRKRKRKKKQRKKP